MAVVSEAAANAVGKALSSRISACGFSKLKSSTGGTKHKFEELDYRFGFPFKNPVELRVIKKPMDLGTIKQKSDDNKYKDVNVLGSENVSDIQLSKSRALRVAMLKNRFADTISKAQQNTLFQSGCGTDSMKLQQRKNSLEIAGRAKIEAQQRASEKAELMRRRQQARMELEKMEQSVDVEDNFHVVREFEKLIGLRN